jgi:hypothetical protein
MWPKAVCLIHQPSDLVNIYFGAMKRQELLMLQEEWKPTCMIILTFDLANLVSAAHVGCHQAEQLMWCFFESKNHQKAILRMGDVDHGTVEMEKLHVLNSFAESLGYKEEDQLPYQGLIAPKRWHDSPEEYMGFRHAPTSTVQVMMCWITAEAANAVFDSVEDEEVLINDAENNNKDAGEDLEFAEMLNEMYGDDDNDIKEPANDFKEYAEAMEWGTTEIDRQLKLLNMSAAKAAKEDVLNAVHIQQELNCLLPESTAGRETTLEAFKRFTNNAPWIPFQDPKSTSIADSKDKDEVELFTKLMEEGNYGNIHQHQRHGIIFIDSQKFGMMR